MSTLGLERINLLGHSFGGLLAMYYATTYPLHIEKLLLLDTAAASRERLFPYFYLISGGYLGPLQLTGAFRRPQCACRREVQHFGCDADRARRR